MATVTPSNLFIYADTAIATTAQSVARSWRDRLAGTAFVEATPMQGVVMAISLTGPEIVGVADIDETGNWEIINIAESHDGEDLLVIGVPRDTAATFAVVSRVKAV